jgi:hypothetical protein
MSVYLLCARDYSCAVSKTTIPLPGRAHILVEELEGRQRTGRTMDELDVAGYG